MYIQYNYMYLSIFINLKLLGPISRLQYKKIPYKTTCNYLKLGYKLSTLFAPVVLEIFKLSK